MRIRSRTVVALSILWALAGSGCTLQNLKQSNRRLKESNGRLVAENNRLESELSSLRRELQSARTNVPAPQPAAVVRSNAPDDMTDISREIAAAILDDPGVTIDRTSDGVRILAEDRVFFALGQVTLTERGKQVLTRVARLLNSEYAGRTVRVDGHTDDTPIRRLKKVYPTNWELSTARACAVVRFLVDNGVSATTIYPAGFAYFRPAAPGQTVSARSKNRRVEITILDERV